MPKSRKPRVMSPAIPTKWRTLRLANGQGPRITPDDHRISVFDVIEATGYSNPRDMWQRLTRNYPRVTTLVSNYRFKGRGQQLTPITNLSGLLEILALVPGRPGDLTRHELVDKYTRYLNGDVSMIEEMIDRQENVEDLERVEACAKARLSQKILGAAIKDCGGTNTKSANTYATVNDRNNVAVLGARARAIQAVSGNHSTRDSALVDKVRLSLIHTTEMLEAHSLGNGEAHGHVAIVCTCDTVASDIEALRRKHGVADVLSTN